LLVLGILLLTVIVPLQGKNYSDEDPSPFLGQVVWSIAYVAAAVRLISLRGALQPLIRGSLLLVALLALDFASTLWSVDVSVTFKNAIELIGTTLIGYYIVVRFKLAEFVGILMAFFAAAALMSLALIVFSPGRGRMYYGSGPWDGIYQDKNGLGAAMATAIIVYLIYLLRPQVKRKALAFLAILGFGGLLIGSNSVTASVDCVVVVAVGGLLLAFASPTHGVAARVAGVAIAVLGTLGAVIFRFDPARLYALLGRNTTLTGRADFWPYLLDAIHAKPIFGYGYGAFFRAAVSDDYLSYYVVEAGGWKPYHAHNSFFQVLLDTGYLGLTLMIAILAVGFVRTLRYFINERTVLSLWPLLMILNLTIGSYSETYLGNYNTIGWIAFVAAILYPLRDRVQPPVLLRRGW
jgi:exopolysaccharide production protein ExoQ